MTTMDAYSEDTLEEENMEQYLGEDAVDEDEQVSYEEIISDHTGITSDDSVSLYLNEMSRVPL